MPTGRLMVKVALAVLALGLLVATTKADGSFSKTMRWLPSQALKATPIVFQKGHSSCVLREPGKIDNTVLQYYTLNAKKGQRLSVHYQTIVSGSGFVVCRVDKNGKIVGGLMTPYNWYGVTDWSKRLPATGRYVVRVLQQRSSQLRIELR